MKDYSYAKFKVVYLKNRKAYTVSSTGMQETDDILQANHWFPHMEDERILGYLDSELREEAEIHHILIMGMLYDNK